MVFDFPKVNHSSPIFDDPEFFQVTYPQGLADMFREIQSICFSNPILSDATILFGQLAGFLAEYYQFQVDNGDDEVENFESCYQRVLAAIEIMMNHTSSDHLRLKATPTLRVEQIYHEGYLHPCSDEASRISESDQLQYILDVLKFPPRLNVP